MVDRIVQTKEILKGSLGIDGLVEGDDDSIYLTYKEILKIEKRMRFLSSIAIANTERAIMRLTTHSFNLNDSDATTSLLVNTKLRNPYAKRRTGFVWEWVERILKVGYFLKHECNGTFLTSMYENPAELSAVCNQKVWEKNLEEYEICLHRERFVEAEAINRTWNKRDRSIKNTTLDFKLYEVRAAESLQNAGKGFFEMAACWRAYGVHPAFSGWKDTDMEVKDMPGLGKIRRGISVVRKQELLSSNSEGLSSSINNDAQERDLVAKTPPNAKSSQGHPIQQDQVMSSKKGGGTTVLNAPEATPTSKCITASKLSPVPTQSSRLPNGIPRSISISNAKTSKKRLRSRTKSGQTVGASIDDPIWLMERMRIRR
ncbi:hypothetical protein DSL72_005200 [Monilinia vaccinii-corymbosi]|uniref:Uncharacterized protein n=1 Tax=Monilinia vaccinii-corymbosi TaxID=61207 RepID=A0A8A3PEI9_9HELO|nr:hypothetical protein DSL72_005200 [Monilinia vaccinii-corymbosi]